MHMVKEKIENIKKRLKLPILVAPMFLVSGLELVKNACLSRVMAAFPCTNARTLEDLETWMQTLAALPKTAAPWVANMIVHQSYVRFEEELNLVKKYKPELVITALGSPKRVLEAVHSYGGLVFADVNSVFFAKKAVEAGVDGLILVCAGAGGHTGLLSPFAFLDEVRQFWEGSVILAGSISHGKTIRACQVLGADLAYMGTRFITTEESLAQDEYKKMLTHTKAEDIILTASITGVAGNFIRESLLKSGIDEKLWDQKAKIDFSSMHAHSTAKAWKDIWSAGQGVGNSQKIVKVSELIDELYREYQQTLQLMP